MAAVIVVTILETAAEAYAKELALSLGAGLVEALFNQGEIARDLNEIKKELAVLSDFIRNRLPILIERSVDLSFAKRAEFEVVEKANTIRGAIAALQAALENDAPEANIQFLVSELAGHADALFETGGALISYGQPYYASVAVAFGMSVKAYAQLVSVAPERFESLYTRAGIWRRKLLTWVDPSQAASFVGVLDWLEGRHALGQKTVPSFETWNTGTTREVLISWEQKDDSIWLFGAWFGYWRDRGLNGNMLYRILPSGTSVEQAAANGQLRYTMPEWWAVKANVPTSRADYEQCAEQLSTLIHDYYSYTDLAPPLQNSVALVKSMLHVIDTVLARADVIDLATVQPLGHLVTEAVPTAAQQSERVKLAMQPGRLGLGLTRRF